MTLTLQGDKSIPYNCFKLIQSLPDRVAQEKIAILIRLLTFYVNRKITIYNSDS